MLNKRGNQVCKWLGGSMVFNQFEPRPNRHSSSGSPLRQLIMREETQLLDVRKIHRLDVVAVKARPTSPMDIYQKQCCHTNVLFFFRVVWYLVERCWNAASWRMLCKSWTWSSPTAIICIAVFWFCERFGTQATLAHYDPKQAFSRRCNLAGRFQFGV